MSEDDNWEDFGAYLRELRTDQIKIKLALEQIIHPPDRALAELELKRREEESELSQLRQDLAECRRHLHSVNTTKWVAIALACAAVLVMASIMFLG